MLAEGKGRKRQQNSHGLFWLFYPNTERKQQAFFLPPALPASSVRPALLGEGCGQSSSPPHPLNPRLQVDVRIAVPTQAQASGVHSLSDPSGLSARAGSLLHVCVSAAVRFSSFSLA